MKGGRASLEIGRQPRGTPDLPLDAFLLGGVLRHGRIAFTCQPHAAVKQNTTPTWNTPGNLQEQANDGTPEVNHSTVYLRTHIAAEIPSEGESDVPNIPSHADWSPRSRLSQLKHEMTRKRAYMRQLPVISSHLRTRHSLWLPRLPSTFRNTLL